MEGCAGEGESIARMVFPRGMGRAGFVDVGRMDGKGVETGLQRMTDTSAVNRALAPSGSGDREVCGSLYSVTSIGTPKLCSQEDWTCTTSPSPVCEVPYLRDVSVLPL